MSVIYKDCKAISEERVSPHLLKRCLFYLLKVVYFDKFSVITDIFQLRMVCRDLTNFGQAD